MYAPSVSVMSYRSPSVVSQPREKNTSISLAVEITLFSEFAICYRPSVCLSSVTLVRPTQAVEIFGNISAAFGTLAIR